MTGLAFNSIYWYLVGYNIRKCNTKLNEWSMNSEDTLSSLVTMLLGYKSSKLQ